MFFKKLQENCRKIYQIKRYQKHHKKRLDKKRLDKKRSIPKKIKRSYQKI
jgi:hypothetical protein